MSGGLDLSSGPLSTLSRDTRKFLSGPKLVAEEQRIEVRDAETGEVLVLNTVPLLSHSNSSGGGSGSGSGAALLPLTRNPSSSGPPVPPGAPTTAVPLPSSASRSLLPTLEAADLRDKAVTIELIRQHHQRQMAALIAMEAGRERMRREVLAREESKWRRTIMKKSFLGERLAGAEAVKQLQVDQALVLAAKLKEFGMLGK
jgi:hypothetical protein